MIQKNGDKFTKSQKKKREIQIPSKGLQLSLSVLPGRSSAVDTHPISVSDFHGTKQSRHVVTEPTLFLFSLPRCALPVLCRQKQHQYLCRFQVAIQFTPLLIGEEKLEVTEKQVNKCQNSHYAPQHKLGNTILEGPCKQNALTSKHREPLQPQPIKRMIPGKFNLTCAFYANENDQ